MSHAIGAVRFEDGLILFYEYNGTADICESVLRDTPDEVWAHWREQQWWNGNYRCRCGQDEPVTIHTTYGFGCTWRGRACRHCRVFTDGTLKFEIEDASYDDSPSWTQGIYKQNNGR